MDIESINKKLRKFFEFNEDDLYANNQGRLSQKQEKLFLQLNQGMRLGGIYAGGFFVVLTVCIGGLTLLGLLIGVVTKNWNGLTGSIIIGAIGSIILGSIGGLILWSTFRTKKSKGVVHRLSGSVSIRIEQRTTHSTHDSYSREYKVHFMKINDVEFALDDELIGVVHEGDEFSLNYYDYGVEDGRAPLILTMEKL